ncbi:MAG: hypothetical protein IKY45_04125 [Clostridia bacterium]|nr:hypothetical protein [Clostridia bacterium]
MPRVLAAPKVDLALKFYFEFPELETSHIKELFGGVSRSAINNLKKKARAQMEADNIVTFSPSAVETDAAFKAWNINIEALKRKHKQYSKIRGDFL